MEPEPVAITRVTVIAAEAFGDEAAAREWLESCRGRGSHGAEAIEEAVAHVNRAVAAYRVAAADPLARDIGARDAVRVRLGHGTGEEVVDGTWRECYLMPAGTVARTRRRMLAPEQELAGILGARRPPPQPSEELTLRARLDLDHARHTEAALEARAAVEALRSEVEADGSDSLGAEAGLAERLWKAALEGSLGARELDQLGRLVERLERLTRQRRHAPEKS